MYKYPTTKMTIGHQNVQGLNNKDLDLSIFLAFNDFDIFCITETWLDNAALGTFNVDNYTIVSSSQRKKYKRGNTLIYVKKDLKAKNRPDIVELSVDKLFEVACVELDNLIVIVIYRAPSAPISLFVPKLDECLMKATKGCQKTILVCGDFNINFPLNKNQTHDLSDIMDSYLLTQQIFEYTRITPKTRSCIDNIFTDSSVDSACVMSGIKSDHMCQKIVLNSTSKKTSNIKTSNIETKQQRFFTKGTIEHLKIEIKKIPRTLDFKAYFKEFLGITDLFLPRKTIKKNYNQNNIKNWITKGIKISREKLRLLRSLLSVIENQVLADYVKRYSRIFKKVTVQAKKMSLRNRVIKSNDKIKTTWKIIKEISGKTLPTETNIILKTNNGEISDKSQIANHFNNYFKDNVCVITKDLGTNVANSMVFLAKFVDRVEDSKIFYPTNEIELKIVLKQLKPKNSTDTWCLSAKLIKILSDELLGPLSSLINETFETGIFPDELKIAKVIPLHKKGDICDVQNYRPISLLPIFSKIYEKIMYLRLMKHVNKYNLINERQFGFRRNKSTNDALAHMIKLILTGLDARRQVVGIFCDLTKAFDCVHHGVLLEKLEHYGVRGTDLLLCQSYLSQRTQYTDVNGTKSELGLLNCGVPQGSVLGPLFFLMYINDLSACFSQNTEIVMFADDISLVVTDLSMNGVCGKLESTLKDIRDWFNVNNLLLNFKKTQVIRFALGSNSERDNNVLNTLLQNHSLSLSQTVKFLGLLLDSKLTYKPCIDEIAKKLGPACYAIKKVKELCGVETAKLVYHAYFHNIMSYGLLLWGTAAEANRIFVLQKRAVRHLLGLNTRDSCQNAFNELNIMTLWSTYVLHNLIYIKKNLTNYNIVHRSERRIGSVRHPMHRLRKVSKSFLCNGVKFYNKLSCMLKEINLNRFKKIMKKLLIRKSYYEIREAILDKTVFDEELLDIQVHKYRANV